jgi:phosphoenolpyruvate carboxylase
VLTAHPTEARRRTLLVALRRIGGCSMRSTTRSPRRRGRGPASTVAREITILWHTGDLRAVTPTPLDEVRSALAIFDETLFTAVPGFERALDRALVEAAGPGSRTDGPALAADAGRSGTRPPGAPAMLRFGSWIGADRDGHPGVTAETTLHAARLQADHVLHGYEAVAARLMQTVAARVTPERVDRALGSALARDAEELPEIVRQLRRRFPEEPYRQRLGAIAERLRRTRAALTGETAPRTGGYPSAAALDAELAVVQEALAADRLSRVAWASSRTCAGRSRHSGSTWPRSRSASTRRSTARRSRRSSGAPGRMRPSRPTSRWARCWQRSGRSRASRRGSASMPVGGT